MCFFTEPGIIPKKHKKYYTKLNFLSIDSENDHNNVFIYSVKSNQTSQESRGEKEENQSLNTIAIDLDKSNTITQAIIRDENLNYPEIYK